MKGLLIFSSFLFTLLIGCSQTFTGATLRGGVYKGTFTRMSPTVKYVPSNVTLTIIGNNFTGTSDKPNFPAICSGSFTKKANKINVVNECMFTADFDWTLMFKGEYAYSISGDEIKLTKTYSSDSYDQFVLQKQ